MVILDINLPDGSGYGFLESVRKESQIPVIMLTANDMEIDEVRGIEMGADDYITKPFSLMVLRARVERLFARQADRKARSFRRKDIDFPLTVRNCGGRKTRCTKQDGTETPANAGYASGTDATREILNEGSGRKARIISMRMPCRSLWQGLGRN